jgi:hypothetical protein
MQLAYGPDHSIGPGVPQRAMDATAEDSLRGQASFRGSVSVARHSSGSMSVAVVLCANAIVGRLPH